MSGDKITSTRPSMGTYEEIINDLTSGLESTCIKPNMGKKPNISLETGDSVRDSQSSSDEDDEEAIPSTAESKTDLPESDLIDEDALKEEELNLTTEEKNQRKIKADTAKVDGNEYYKNGKYNESIESYTHGLKICPLEYVNERAILYANRGASKSKIALLQSAIEDCSKAIELNPRYVKALCRRAHFYEQDDKLDQCLEDYKKVLEIDPGHADARAAAFRLPPLINERNEKMKTEMMGKLKDLGNMILKPFGLSTNNFEMKQDPNSGGYSINFNQNAK